MTTSSLRLPDGSSEAVNAGETLHKGIELGLGVQLVRGLRLDGAYSLAEHTYEDWRPDRATDYSGNEQEFAPSRIANARVRIEPPALPGALVTFEWSRIGPYWMDADNQNEYSGHHLFNVRASYDVTDRVQLFGRVNNLADERYAERASYNEFRGQELSPGLPRAIYAGVRIR